MVQIVTSYECGICRHKYLLEENAIECEEQGTKGLFDDLEVGTVVQTAKRWAWHAFPRTVWTTTGPAETDFEKRIKKVKLWFSPYYVITAVTVPNKEHWARYHFVCPVWVSGKAIILWTEPGCNAAPIRVYDAPKEVTAWAESGYFETKYRGKLGGKYV